MRRPAVLALLLLLSAAPAAAQTPTAREVIARIQRHTGVVAAEGTVDTFKAGDPDAPVKGIAVTMMATYDVLRRAAEAGHNLVITHEPAFYGHFDDTAALRAANDPVLAAKEALIAAHGLVVWRAHDDWHRRDPDGIRVGMVRALGWEGLPVAADAPVYTLPETTVGALAADLRDRLGIRTLRVVGDPEMTVRRVGLAPGAPGFEPQRALLAREDVEVLVIGEAREWETIPYAADAAAAGHRKALVVLGHIPSEQAGMEEFARWLRTFVDEVPVAFVPAREPFRTP